MFWAVGGKRLSRCQERLQSRFRLSLRHAGRDVTSACRLDSQETVFRVNRQNVDDPKQVPAYPLPRYPPLDDFGRVTHCAQRRQ